MLLKKTYTILGSNPKSELGSKMRNTLSKVGDMILWDFYATFVRMHELQVSLHISKMMLFESAQWSCEHER